MKKYLFFIVASTISLLSSAQQGVQNFDFELWTNVSGVDAPNGWVVSVPGAKESADVQNGSYSLKLETQSVPFLGNMSGFAIIGTLQGTTIVQGEPWSGGKPNILNGYYKYNILSGDTGVIIVNFTRWTGDSTKVIGATTHFIDGSQTNWNCFSLPISWDVTDPNTPDSVTVFLAASANNIQGMNNYGTQAVGSTLQADNLCFDCGCSTTKVNELNKNNIQVFYQNRTLNIVSASNENYQVEIYNITGQKVKYSNTQKQIDLSDLSDGSYIYVIKNKTGEVIQKEKFVIAE